MTSLNGTHEILELTKLGFDVDYRQVATDRPRISDLLLAIRESKSPVAGIINADTFFIDDPPILEAIMHAAAKGMMIVERINIDPVRLRPTGITCSGFDAFIFNTTPLSRIDLDIDFLIGHPWWDYWFPLAYAVAGGKLMTTDAPFLFHLDHTQNWNWTHFNRNGNKFLKYLLKHSGQLPEDFVAEISRFSESTVVSEGELRSFSLWCFPRLQSLPELIGIPPSRGNAGLLSALISILPDQGVLRELRKNQSRIMAFEECNPAFEGSRTIADTRGSNDAQPRMPKGRHEPTLADRLERIGDGLALNGDRITASLLYRAAAELDLRDADLQSSWGRPLNGQSGRQALFCELAAHFQFDAVIETGTCRAATAAWIARQFEVGLHTCETNERLFCQSKTKLAGLKNVVIELTDSINFLTRFAAEHRGVSNILIYLDAHCYSSFPLLEEIEVIRLHFPGAVVMIDDFEIPTDAGYGFDYYSSGRIGLALLGKFRNECHIFLPTLPSQDETGERRGVAVLSWDREVGRRLADVPGLRPATDSDWAAAFAATEEKPLASAYESSTDSCEGNVDRINGAPPNQLPRTIVDRLAVQGWLAISGKDGILPDAVFVTITDEQGHKVYLKTRRSRRPDVMEYFKQPNMLDAGFETADDIKRFSGNFLLGISRVYDGRLESCNQLTFPLSIDPTIEPIGPIEPQSVRRPHAAVLLIKRWGGGFWSDIDHVVGQLALAEMLGRVPIVQWGVDGPYGNGRGETFTLYFQPVSGLKVQALKGSIWPDCWTHSNIGSQLPFPATGQPRPPYDYYQLCMEKAEYEWALLKTMYRNEDVLVSVMWENPEDIIQAAPPGSRFHGKTADELRRLVVTERLRLRPTVREKVDRFWRENLDGYATLAVHTRGSDKAIVENKTLHAQNATALQMAREWPGKIFLLTDSERYRMEWVQILGRRLVVQDCLRTDSETIPNFLLPNADGYRNGIEILVDTYTAARCDRFIGTYSSNVGKYVAAIGGHQAGRITYVDRL
ncbi:MAG: O-fucosyltransferase family protein [Steroidobacteraceae bacterium]